MKATWLASGDPIDVQTLDAQGVFSACHPVDEASWRAPMEAIKARHGYVEEDVVALSPSTPGLDAICAKFVDEHFHDEDEVRFVLDGAGVFEIRSQQDQWMHVLVEQGDLIVVPAGRYHRFMLTESRNIRCLRLFKDASGWTPHYRD